jgi:hypothetical protein
MFALLLSMQPALADRDVSDSGGCLGNVLVDHRPVNDAENVPYNARVLLAFEQDDCSSSTVEVQAINSEGEDWGEFLAFDPFVSVLAWIPEPGWTPGLYYYIGVETAQLPSFEFHVGDLPAETIAGPPTLSIYDASARIGLLGSAVIDVDLHVSSQPDSMGLTLIQVFSVADPDVPLVTKFGTGTGEIEIAVGLLGGEDDVEVCLTALQIDPTGLESSHSSADCVELVWTDGGRCGGCGVGVLGGGWAGLMLVGVLVGFRREGG